jgi:hypothetical protein
MRELIRITAAIGGLYQRIVASLCLVLSFSAVPMVASAVTLQDGQAQITNGNWFGAKQTFTALAPTNCEAKYLLGYATANLRDAEGTADAEIGALHCALPAGPHAHALSLLQWSLSAMSKERLGPPTNPWYQNKMIPAKPNPLRARRDALVAAAVAFLPNAESDMQTGLSANACDVLDMDYNPTPDENAACMAYDATFDPVPKPTRPN